MPRILVVTSVHPSEDPRISRRTVRSLATRFAVRYAAAPPEPALQGIEWQPLQGGRAMRATRAFREMLRSDVDLIAVHDPELVPLAALAGRVRRVPVVFDVHEDLLARYERGGRGRGAGCPFILRCATRALWLVERHVQPTLAEPRHQRMFRRDAPVFPNHPASDLPAARPAEPDSPVIYVGDISAERGVLVLLRAMSLAGAPRVLELVGRCPPQLSATIRRQADALGLAVTLRGWQPPETAMALVAGAAVGVCPLLDRPNYRWALPTKVLEYLAVGIPVVASDLPGTAAAIGGRPGVTLVPPADPAALAAALTAALDPDVRAQAVAGAASFRSSFTWPEQTLIDVYAGLLDR